MAPPDRRNRSIKIVSVLAAICNCLLWWASCWGYGGYNVLGFLPGGHPYQQFPPWQPHGIYGEVSEEELWCVRSMTNLRTSRDFTFVTDNTTTNPGTGVVEGHVDRDGITRTTDVTAGQTVDKEEPLTGWVGAPGRSIAQPQPHLHNWIYLRTVDLAASFVAGTPFAIQPYLEFMQLAYVNDVLRGRRIGKLGLEVKFTFQPTAYHYGVFVAAWCPYLTRRLITGTEAGGYTTVIAEMKRWCMSRKHRVVMNLAKPMDAVLSCPIPGGSEMLLLQASQSDAISPLGEHYVYVSPVTTPSRVDVAYTSVPLEIYVRLVEGSSLYDLTTTALVSGPTAEGPLSGLLRTGGDFASAFGRLTGFKVFDPIAAVARLGATGARAMGLGTPVAPPPAHLTGNSLPMGVVMHSDDRLSAPNMSTSASTAKAVALRDGEDEMSISHVASRWSLLQVYTMGSASSADTKLATIRVDPMFVPYLTTSGIPTALSWLSSPFLYWRGSLRYRFTVAGSKYHSGRVRVVYEPAATYNPATMTLAYGTHCYNEVIDVGEGTVVEFDVPWSQSYPWGNVRLGAGSDITPSASGTAYDTTSNGTLVLLVETPLSSVAASTPDIQIMVEVAGGLDFELAGLVPAHAAYRAISAKTGGEASSRLRALGEGVPFLGARAACIGDTSMSLRDLCKVVAPAGFIQSKTQGSSTTALLGQLDITAMPPPYYLLRNYGMSNALAAGDTPYNKVCLTNYGIGPGDALPPRDYFSVAYAEVSGGLHLVVEAGPVARLASAATDLTGTNLDVKDLHALVVDHTVLSGTDTTFPLKDWTSTEATFTYGDGCAALANYHVRARLATGPLDVVIPHQGCMRTVVGWDPCPGGTTASAISDNADTARPDRPRQFRLFWWGPVANSAQASPLLSWGGAEDFNCAYFDGPPPVQVTITA